MFKSNVKNMMGMSSKSKYDIQSKKALLPILDVLESLRTFLDNDSIEIPGVVVTGYQSSGKSSLLESIAGVNLPCGNNLTTRVPLIIRLEYAKNAKKVAYIDVNSSLEDCETIENMDNIPQKIEEYTEKVAGNGELVTNNPIHLKIIQSECPSVNIIDLPGITHMSVESNQDIHKQTTELVSNYISNSRMIILCVIPACDDFANSEALKLAKEADSEGIRTIGVISKLDICQENITDKIKGIGKNLKLRLGFIAIKNRSLSERSTTFSLSDIVKSESKFFKHSQFYSELDKQYWGLDTLLAKIVNLQNEYITTFLPEIKNEIHSKLHTLKIEKSKFNQVLNNEIDKTNYIISKIVECLDKFTKLVDDECILFQQFNDFSENMGNCLPNYFDNSYHSKIKEFMETKRGAYLSNFLHPQLFKSLYVELEEKFQEVIHSLIYSSVNAIKNATVNVFKDIVSDYVKLYDKFCAFIGDYIGGIHGDIQKYLKLLLSCEQMVYTQQTEYINQIQDIKHVALHTDNFDNYSNIPNEFLKNYGSYDSSDIDYYCCEMQISLYVYTNIVKNRLCDNVPMILYKFLVTDFKQNLMQKCISFMNNYNDLFDEDENHKAKKQFIDNSIKNLSKSLEYIENYQ